MYCTADLVADSMFLQCLGYKLRRYQLVLATSRLYICLTADLVAASMFLQHLEYQEESDAAASTGSVYVGLLRIDIAEGHSCLSVFSSEIVRSLVVHLADAVT